MLFGLGLVVEKTSREVGKKSREVLVAVPCDFSKKLKVHIRVRLLEISRMS